MSMNNERPACMSAGAVSTSTDPPMAANDRALSGVGHLLGTDREDDIVNAGRDSLPREAKRRRS